MALELKIQLTAYDDLLTWFQITDKNADLDTAKQYGQSGNPARASLGLFLYVTKKEVGDTEDSIIYNGLSNGDPENATFWQIPYAEDNWYESVLIAAQDYNAGTSYVTNDLTYHSNRLYMSLQDANEGNTPDSNPDYWQDVTEDKDNILANATTTYFWYKEYNRAPSKKSQVYLARLIADDTKNGICKSCDHEDKSKINKIRRHLNGAAGADYQQLWTQAQWNILTLKTLCVDG